MEGVLNRKRKEDRKTGYVWGHEGDKEKDTLLTGNRRFMTCIDNMI